MERGFTPHPWRGDNLATQQQIEIIYDNITNLPFLVANAPLAYISETELSRHTLVTVVPSFMPDFVSQRSAPDELFRVDLTEQPDMVQPSARRRSYSMGLVWEDDIYRGSLRVARYDISRLRELQRELSERQLYYQELRNRVRHDSDELKEANMAVRACIFACNRTERELRARAPYCPATVDEAKILMDALARLRVN